MLATYREMLNCRIMALRPSEGGWDRRTLPTSCCVHRHADAVASACNKSPDYSCRRCSVFRPGERRYLGQPQRRSVIYHSSWRYSSWWDEVGVILSPYGGYRAFNINLTSTASLKEMWTWKMQRLMNNSNSGAHASLYQHAHETALKYVKQSSNMISAKKV